MTLLKHELRQNKTSLIIWSAIISFMLAICVIIYPEMATQMGDISKMFADMGSFSAAFGMDQINFGTLLGYYSIECGNVLGMGGAFFAAICGAGVLAKEEKERTAEFLLTHPVSRRKIITDAFNQMGFPCFSPLGAFYIFPCIKSSGMTSEEFCERLLKEEKVALVPGTAFGESGEGFVRVSYAYSIKQISKATERIANFAKSIKKG